MSSEFIHTNALTNMGVTGPTSVLKDCKIFPIFQLRSCPDLYATPRPTSSMPCSLHFSFIPLSPVITE